MPKISFIGPLAVAFMAAALPAAAPAATAPAYTPREISDYADALLQIMDVRRITETRWKSASPLERPALRQQAQAAITGILARHQLDQTRFNQITAIVEAKPALQRQVRRRVMQQKLDLN